MTATNASEEAYDKIKNEMARLQGESKRRVTMSDALDSLLGILKGSD